MAIGDAAAARGMELASGMDPANTIDDLVNETRDYIDEYTRWGKLAEKPTSFPNSDVTNASALSTAGPNTLVKRNSEGMFGVPTPTVSTHPANKAYVDGVGDTSATPNTIMRRNSNGQVAVADATTAGMAVNKGYVDAQLGEKADKDIVGEIEMGFLHPNVYSRTLSGSWRNLYIKSTGELGWVSSSRRSKKNIKNWTPDRQAILAMQIVEFQYKVAIDPDGQVQHGLIAEQLHELGLEWLVDYGTSGTPEGVRYDLISLALLSVVQDHEERLTRLEQA